VSSTPDTAGEATCGLVHAAAGFDSDPLQLALAKTTAVTKSTRHPARTLNIIGPHPPTSRRYDRIIHLARQDLIDLVFLEQDRAVLDQRAGPVSAPCDVRLAE